MTPGQWTYSWQKLLYMWNWVKHVASFSGRPCTSVLGGFNECGCRYLRGQPWANRTQRRVNWECLVKEKQRKLFWIKKAVVLVALLSLNKKQNKYINRLWPTSISHVSPYLVLSMFLKFVAVWGTCWSYDLLCPPLLNVAGQYHKEKIFQ